MLTKAEVQSRYGRLRFRDKPKTPDATGWALLVKVGVAAHLKKADNFEAFSAGETAEPMNPMHRARRCGARTRRGHSCRAPAVKGKRRCRMHGGFSTGPRTAEGLERSRRARWIHGRYSREAHEARAAKRLLRQPTHEEKQRFMRRWAREDKRAARRSLGQLRAAMRRLIG